MDIRELSIIITSGVFTSSCVVFIISIREYYDERTAALRNLYRLISYIDEKYQQIHFFTSTVPEDIIDSYLREEYYLDKKKKKWEELSSITGEEFPSELLKNFENARKKYRESVWKYEDEAIKELYDVEEEREKYLDKKCEERAEGFLSNAEELINSLYVIRDFDVYQVQEAFDRLHFFIHKNYKTLLEGTLIPFTVTSIKLLKYYLNLVSTNEDEIDGVLMAVHAINCTLLVYDETREHAYLRPSYQIALAKRYISSMQTVFGSNKNNIEAPNIDNFLVYPHYDVKHDFGEDVLLDSWGIR